MTDRNHDLLELIDAKRRVEELEKENARLHDVIKTLRDCLLAELRKA